ncbi:MAG: hypothetical protein ACP5OB_02770 [Candidatus Ratteibacteria bacterium]
MKSKYLLKKYKSFKEAEFDIWILNQYKKNNDFKLKFLFSNKLLNRILKKIPHGLYKYRTLKEANKDKLKWLIKD